MKIAINSPSFLPRIGGLENVTEILAREFVAQGHEVRVLCQVEDDFGQAFPFEVVRKPGWLRTVACWRWADVVMHMNVSLKGLLPIIWIRRPWVATHHGWYSRPEAPPNINARLKIGLARWLATANIAVSHAVQRYLNFPCVVIPNPYSDRVFRLMPEVARNRELLFVGRLVSDKAPNLLLEAAHLLKQRGLRPGITFTGSGPEEELLKQLAEDLGIANQVAFTGVLKGHTLAREMNRHRILVVPSSIQEGFGIVALEGIACGCMVIGARVGGLPEAIGPCGRTFPPNDANALADEIAKLLPLEVLQFDKTAPHLSNHVATHVANCYLDVLKAATSCSESHST